MEGPVDEHKDPEVAVEMAARAVLGILRECGIEGEQEKRYWITRVFDRVIAQEFSQSN